MILSTLFIFSLIQLSFSRPTEQERVALWYESGNTWPPGWQDETEGYRRLMEERDAELIRVIPGSDERWENYMQYTQGRMVPKFTARGFDVVDTPHEIHEKLYNAVKKQVDNFDNLPYEHDVDCIYHPPGLAPKFAYLQNLAREVHHELLPYHEAWGGMKLRPTSAYGVRLYQNGSSLVMHHDKVHSHVISSIVHIIHEGPNWPIDIESHDTGELFSLELQPGQMLFYESAKCLHGRMSEFKGKYYGSIFLHYQPVDTEIWNYTVEDVIANVPPHWHMNITEDKGSRWAGQAVTVDSRVASGAPLRVSMSDPRFRESKKGKHVRR